MIIKKITVVVICIFILGLSAGSIMIDKKDYSENENRHLAEMPELSLSNIINKEYMTDIEQYMCDHFPMRDEFMNVYAAVQQAEGSTEINGVYICDDGYLIEKHAKYSNLDRISERLLTLRSNTDRIDKNISIDVMLIPTSYTVNKNRLPDHAYSDIQLDATEQIRLQAGRNINYIDVTDTLIQNNKNQQMFYRTDHHWTTYGAYYAYIEYCRDKGIQAGLIDKYKIETVSDSFYGTVYSKVNDMSVRPDNMTAFIDPDLHVKVTYQNILSDSLYNYDYLDTKDKYSFFLNNINDVINIVNIDCHNGRRLLIAKDSYANCFVPFLVNNYETITVLDTRYYMYGISTLLEQKRITDILILYNMNTIDSDTGINGIY